MADGSRKAISAIVVGDRVVAVDPATGERSIETVEAVWSHPDELVELRVEGGYIVTTEDHPFWDADDARWEEARQLVAGEHLLAADGDRIRVLGLVPGTEHDGTAWNLTVSGPHTYHVAAGDGSVLVHNCPRRAPGSDAEAVRASKRSLVRENNLPTGGRFRFVPSDEYLQNPKQNNNFVDRYGNIWQEGTAHGLAHKLGDAKEWDVQLSASGVRYWGKFAKRGQGGGWYIIVTRDGRLSH